MYLQTPYKIVVVKEGGAFKTVLNVGIDHKECAEGIVDCYYTDGTPGLFTYTEYLRYYPLEF